MTWERQLCKMSHFDFEHKGRGSTFACKVARVNLDLNRVVVFVINEFNPTFVDQI